VNPPVPKRIYQSIADASFRRRGGLEPAETFLSETFLRVKKATTLLLVLPHPTSRAR
jgi:hypothetical protein